jgi:hypothetical protein
MILAASFAGEGAQQDAHELVIELRSRYQLPAYVHQKHYDFSQPVEGRGLDKQGGPKIMRHRRQVAYDEIAVVVGDFESVEDPQLQKALKQIKYAEPKCLRLKEGEDTTLRFAGLRAAQKRLTTDPLKRDKGPMGLAFATRNPLLPVEYFVPRGIDKLVLSMNKNVKYSLLDCPKKYSVRIATFRGNVIIDQRKVEEISSGGDMESQLADAADKAHRLTMALRKKGVEAYEFHDRHESVVTVGGFDAVGTPRADGREEMHPGILRIMKTYGPTQQALPGKTTTALAGLSPKSIAGIPLDIQPWPVEVPRRSIAADYARANGR